MLLVEPDRSAREALQAHLNQLGIGRVLAVTSLAAVEELAGQGIAGDVAALVGLSAGPAVVPIIGILRVAGWGRILVMTRTADPGPVSDALGASVDGVLFRGLPSLPATAPPSAIRTLSRREIDVIALVADGRSNQRIGEQLNLSAATVKSHLARIGRKVGTGDRAHLVACALRGGVIS